MKKTQKLTVSGILIAMAVILSFIKVFELPFGGSITLFSMTPIMLAGFMYGVPWGLLCGVVDGVLQGILGAATTQAFAGLDALKVIGVICLDYLLAFSVLGCAGLFRKSLQNKPTLAIALGALVAGLLRFLVHTTSGAIIYGEWAEWFFTQDGFYSWGATILDRFSGAGLAIVYSVIYNAFYMIPETILSVIAVIALIQVKPLRKFAMNNMAKSESAQKADQV